MSGIGELGNPLRKFKLVFLGEQSGKSCRFCNGCYYGLVCVQASEITCLINV